MLKLPSLAETIERIKRSDNAQDQTLPLPSHQRLQQPQHLPGIQEFSGEKITLVHPPKPSVSTVPSLLPPSPVLYNTLTTTETTSPSICPVYPSSSSNPVTWITTQQQEPQPASISAGSSFSQQQQLQTQLPHATTSPSVDSVSVSPIVSGSTVSTSEVCPVCNSVIRRDVRRHMRTHDTQPRFKCVYPRTFCSHKTGKFNRQYDFKKHLLHSHFVLRDYKVIKFKSLNQKLGQEGQCMCGMAMIARDWLNHIIDIDGFGEYSCADLKEKWALHRAGVQNSSDNP